MLLLIQMGDERSGFAQRVYLSVDIFGPGA